ncbi:MAG TPA: universal stress protein [Nitrososphaeraceae archaeon]|jgi:nucleotide-binding universal stress UspA family protein
MFSKLLVPIDGSDNSFRALDHAIFLSKKITARITALRVIEYLPLVYVQSQRTMDTILSKYLEESESILKKSIDIGEKKGVRIESKMKKGDAASNILNYSKKEDYDTIIMGRRGTGKLRQLVLGSTSTKVLNHSDCTVVIVK